MSDDSGSSDDEERMRARERETRRNARNERMLPSVSPAPSQTADWEEEARQHDSLILQSLLTRETEQHAKLREREVIFCMQIVMLSVPAVCYHALRVIFLV